MSSSSLEPRFSSSFPSASDDPPPEPRVSISSTIPASTANSHSFDLFPPPRTRPPMNFSPDRESFIDLASPTYSPRGAEFGYVGMPPAAPGDKPLPPIASRESSHGKSSSSGSGSKSPAPAPRRRRTSPDWSPPHLHADEVDGPTFASSNALSTQERADRVRTTRKLAQVFGQPPGTSVSPVTGDEYDVVLPPGCLPLPRPLALNLNPRRKQHRPAPSVPGGESDVAPAARRHSAPLSPDDVAFFGPARSSLDSRLSADSHPSTAVVHVGEREGPPDNVTASSAAGHSWRSVRSAAAPGSPLSFIDLSDEEGGDMDLDETRRPGRRRAPSPSAASLAEMELAEDERRRKREKLAKLHRYLGSRVPPHLVLGPLDEGTPLPPPAPSFPDDGDGTTDVHRAKMRRRRSSSAAEFSRTWSDDIDRLKEDLNEREKAINVRRAVKMEKMFGVAPPQTLYHTRAPTAPSPGWRTPVPRSPATPPFRFVAPGSSSNVKSKDSKRPGTGDSSQPLINDADNFLKPNLSSVYMHYRHSLNSLNDIIDRDDKESLAELHDYITGTDPYPVGSEYDFQFANISPELFEEFSVSSPTTSKADRRRSLPSRMSVASFSSDIGAMLLPTPMEGSFEGKQTFQQRRRRAAKLGKFFGVDYKDLMNEILESIEKGVEEERGKGTLKPDEVQDLQQKLSKLKSKRNSLTSTSTTAS
ncbi:uncharacterized protein BXZ73DRAFT_91933 [Epithele typhae]|uniref:uncharacterized protein n=1 Tax=Epithele typhae TaxID=378194 RepID=UPI002007995C|nr:uncharacterized protein BXZ73DRAFT_91933 [Epithele typhae]KAH9920190.1 hypothetical protein BXZ73DRAFT_91933 [Epithele typhae]